MSTLTQLPRLGQSVWMDNLSRAMIEDGSLEARIREQGISGITSNPATFAKAIDGSDAYDNDLYDCREGGLSHEASAETLMIGDVQKACDLLRPTYDRTHGDDGYVSIEVNPWLARDTDRTIETARRLWSA